MILANQFQKYVYLLTLSVQNHSIGMQFLHQLAETIIRLLVDVHGRVSVYFNPVEPNPSENIIQQPKLLNAESFTTFLEQLVTDVSIWSFGHFLVTDLSWASVFLFQSFCQHTFHNFYVRSSEVECLTDTQCEDSSTKANVARLQYQFPQVNLIQT